MGDFQTAIGDQALDGGDVPPEGVYSWTVYAAAESYVSYYNGVIDEQAEEKWLKAPFDFTAENLYNELNLIENPLERATAKGKLYNQHPNFYPAHMDAFIDFLFVYSDAKLSQDERLPPQEGIIDNIMQTMALLLEENPSDQVLKDELADLAAYDPSNDAYNKDFMENPTVKNGVAALVTKLHTKYPNDEDFAYDYALVLRQHGKYDQAITALETLIGKASPANKESYLSTLADFQIQAGHPEEAEKIYTDQGWTDSLCLFYETQGSYGKLMDTFLQGIEKNPSNMIWLSWEEDGGLKTENFGKLRDQFPDKWKDLQGKISVWLKKQATEPDSLPPEDIAHIKQVYGIK